MVLGQRKRTVSETTGGGREERPKKRLRLKEEIESERLRGMKQITLCGMIGTLRGAVLRV